MTSETVRFAKLLIIASLAMSASLVAVATQLDAPSITTIAPGLVAANESAKSASTIPVEAKVTTPSSTIDQTTAIDPATSNVAERSRLVTERMAQAKPKLPAVVAPADWVTTKGAKGEFVYSADRVEARGSFQLLRNVVAKRRVDDRVEVFEAQRAELHGTDQELQSLILYDGKHYFEGQGDDSYKEFERLVLPVGKPRVAAATSPVTNLESGVAASSPATLNPPAINPASIDKPAKRKPPFAPPVTPEGIAQDGVVRWVEVAFTVTVDGTVKDAEVYKSQPDGKMDEAMLTAVRQWLFEPAIKDGKAVATRTMIRWKFNPSPYPNPNTTVRPATATTEKSVVAMATDRPLKRIKTVTPVFPESARLDGINGWVEVAFTVTISGDVQDAEVRSSQPEGIFDEAALTAVRQWRFEPAIKDGKAVATRTMIRMKFDPSAYPNPTARPSGDAAGVNAATKEQGATNASTYTGERLTLKFTDIDVRTVLKLLSDTSGQNIVVSDKVSGKVTVQLSNVPWDEALDIILRGKGLVKRQQGGIIFIEPA